MSSCICESFCRVSLSRAPLSLKGMTTTTTTTTNKSSSLTAVEVFGGKTLKARKIKPLFCVSTPTPSSSSSSSSWPRRTFCWNIEAPKLLFCGTRHHHQHPSSDATKNQNQGSRDAPRRRRRRRAPGRGARFKNARHHLPVGDADFANVRR